MSTITLEEILAEIDSIRHDLFVTSGRIEQLMIEIKQEIKLRESVEMRLEASKEVPIR